MAAVGDWAAIFPEECAADLAAEDDMLGKARKGARGEKSRGGYIGPAVKGGWSAV